MKSLAKKVSKKWLDSTHRFWNENKVQYMSNALEAKFALPEWNKKLHEFTNNDEIIEWNNWNDKFWGVSIYDNIGYNVLGRILMNIRDRTHEKYNSIC